MCFERARVCGENCLTVIGINHRVPGFELIQYSRNVGRQLVPSARDGWIEGHTAQIDNQDGAPPETRAQVPPALVEVFHQHDVRIIRLVLDVQKRAAIGRSR
jgi:hypothetical protein